jgi:hypothetical protein
MGAHLDGFQQTGNEAFRSGNTFAERAIDATKSGAKELFGSTDGVRAGENSEGALTKQIEKVTTRIPSATFLTLAMASIALSAGLRMFGRKEDAQFIGQWVPTILTLGLYNKLVKFEGSE